LAKIGAPTRGNDSVRFGLNQPPPAIIRIRFLDNHADNIARRKTVGLFHED
jgi:hypothetical protein